MKHRCLHCREYQPSESMLMLKVGSFCSMDHAVEYAKAKSVKQREKAKKASDKADKQAKRELAQNHRPTQYRLAREAAQRLANRLDARLPCICCSEPRGRAQFCGGHFKTAGGNPALALDLRNIHGQRNRLCNQAKSGNIYGDRTSHGYVEGLRRRYGQELIDWLEGPQESPQYSCEELRAIRALYDAESRQLEKGGHPTRDWRALGYNVRDLI